MQRFTSTTSLNSGVVGPMANINIAWICGIWKVESVINTANSDLRPPSTPFPSTI